MKKLSARPRRQSDLLLKAAFEEWFTDCMVFLFPDAHTVFDFSKGLTFMDKELRAVIPQRERRKGHRIADLLAKVYLKSGLEKWVLVHTEIEAGSQEDFAFRLFQYHYRLLDRYQVPIETVAVFTGSQKQSRPAEYHYDGIATLIRFRYRSYHIFEHSEDQLLAMNIGGSGLSESFA